MTHRLPFLRGIAHGGYGLVLSPGWFASITLRFVHVRLSGLLHERPGFEFSIHGKRLPERAAFSIFKSYIDEKRWLVYFDVAVSYAAWTLLVSLHMNDIAIGEIVRPAAEQFGAGFVIEHKVVRTAGQSGFYAGLVLQSG